MRKGLWVVLTCVVIAILLFLRHQRATQPVERNEPPAPAARTNTLGPVAFSASASLRPAIPGSNAPGAPDAMTGNPPPPDSTSAAAVSALPPTLQFTNFPATTVMENMRSVFRTYASAFNGNPVGTNPEITAALDGGNPKQTKFIREEEGLRINAKGELIDPWGTPFFFHQLSATEMEIHSAGQDGILWTGDDLVIK